MLTVRVFNYRVVVHRGLQLTTEILKLRAMILHDQELAWNLLDHCGAILLFSLCILPLTHK